ncbi:ABC transporter [Brucella melitensis bv. 1 str. 16M]|nr:ABC transporter [Brucella melitensis bv. 1 str. 16M]
MPHGRQAFRSGRKGPHRRRFREKPALAKTLPDFCHGKQARSRFLVHGLEGRIVNDAVPNRSRLKRAADGFLSVAAALAIWQAVVSIGQMPRFILPGPLDVVHALVANARLIAENAAATIGEVLGGLVLGSAVGIAAAIGLMMSPLAQRLVMPVMVFSQAIPIFALAPILTLWLGYGPASKIAVAVLMIFFPVVSTFFDGMRCTETGLIEAAEILGAGRMAILFRIRIPSAFPALASASALPPSMPPSGRWWANGSALPGASAI